MAKKKTRKKPAKKESSNLILFILFILIAAITASALYYLDQKKSDKDFDSSFHSYLKSANLNFSRAEKKKSVHYEIHIKQDKYNAFLNKLNKLTSESRSSNLLLKSNYKKEKMIQLFKISKKKSRTSYLLVNLSLDIRRRAEIQAEYKQKKIIQKKEKVSNKPESEKRYSARIAFIIDDVGNNDTSAMELAKLNIPVTGAVMPDTPYAFDESVKLHKYGLKSLLHIPMEPSQSKNRMSRREMIMTDSDQQEIESLILRAKAVNPFAVGVNNHMGSLVTTNRKTMKKVLSVLKNYNLFFIDSRTSARSVGYQTARKMNIKTSYRKIFIDHVQTYKHSSQQIDKLIEVALREKEAIAIGHPFSTTFRAIKDSVNRIRSNNIEIVFVTELLH